MHRNVSWGRFQLKLFKIDVSEGIGCLLGIVLRRAGGLLRKPFPDVADHFLKAFGKFVEVLFVQENLVLVVHVAAIPLDPSLAFGDRKIIVVALGGFYIKEVGPLTRSYRLRINVVSISVLEACIVIILKIHGMMF